MVEIRQNWNISDHCMVLLSMLLLLLSAECCRHHRETTHNNHALAHPQPHAGCVGGGRTTHCGCVPPTHFKARGKLLKKAISGQPGYHPAALYSMYIIVIWCEMYLKKSVTQFFCSFFGIKVGSVLIAFGMFSWLLLFDAPFFSLLSSFFVNVFAPFSSHTVRLHSDSEGKKL